jgi:DHA2 family multidrug resistance protein
MLTAASLYGGIYALSIYLGQIQNYSAQQIGLVMMWVGIPQIFLMPLIPFVLKKFDARVPIIIGLALFAYSNYLNSFLSADYAGDQFRISLIFRALGQPLIIIPLSAVGMGSIMPSEAGQASSIFNVMRNLGGSIGIAFTSTLMLSRQNANFSSMIQSVTLHDQSTVDRLNAFQMVFMVNKSSIVEAKSQALTALSFALQKQAAIKTFCQIFNMMSATTAACVLLTLFLRSQKRAGSEDLFH